MSEQHVARSSAPETSWQSAVMEEVIAAWMADLPYKRRLSVIRRVSAGLEKRTAAPIIDTPPAVALAGLRWWQSRALRFAK